MPRRASLDSLDLISMVSSLTTDNGGVIRRFLVSFMHSQNRSALAQFPGCTWALNPMNVVFEQQQQPPQLACSFLCGTRILSSCRNWYAFSIKNCNDW
jgi:hypothetical protein